jgi:hypothetical protein
MSSVHMWVECTHLPLGRWVTMGLSVGRMLVMETAVMRKWLATPKSRMAHSLTAAMLIMTVLRSTAIASAYFGMGVGQC